MSEVDGNDSSKLVSMAKREITKLPAKKTISRRGGREKNH